MSEFPAQLHALSDRVRLALAFDPKALLDDWKTVRAAMVRQRSDAFTRDEWAFLMLFIAPCELEAAWRSLAGEGPPRLLRPRTPVALWLPGNVSLLGPLTLSVLSLAAPELLIKADADASDLTGAWIEFLVQAAPADGPLRHWITTRVAHARFDRTDARNAAYAARARLRLVFGGDTAALAIQALPHPADSLQVSFTDHVSAAWIAAREPDAETVDALLRVFAIYGQAGCTSPAEVVMVDGDAAIARAWRDAAAQRWAQVIPGRPEWHAASANTLALQLARARGWDAVLAGPRAAVLAVAPPETPPVSAPMLLPFTWKPLAQAVASLPANIQTLGTAAPEPRVADWVRHLALSPVKRCVPLARMHHFQFAWDGFEWFRALFETMELG